MDKKINFPNIVEVAGSFGHVGCYDYSAYMSFPDEGLPNLDCVIQTVAQFPILSQKMDPPITIEVVGDGAAAAATLQIDWTGAPADPTILAYAAAGAAGNFWDIVLMDIGAVGLGFETVVEDPVLRVCVIGVDVGASTAGSAEAAVTALGTLITVGTATGTPAAAIVAADCFTATSMTGGAEAQSISVAGSTAAGWAYTVHFTPAATTVGQFNALIPFPGSLLEVPALGVGTIVNVMQAGDVLPQSLLHAPNAVPLAGMNIVASHTALGVYMIVIRTGVAKSAFNCRACISGDAASGKYVVLGTPAVMPNVGVMLSAFVRDSVTGLATDLAVANNEQIQFKAFVKHV
jgi:hypothetical protein